MNTERELVNAEKEISRKDKKGILEWWNLKLSKDKLLIIKWTTWLIFFLSIAVYKIKNQELVSERKFIVKDKTNCCLYYLSIWFFRFLNSGITSKIFID